MSVYPLSGQILRKASAQQSIYVQFLKQYLMRLR